MMYKRKNFVTLFVSQSFWVVAKGYRLYKYNVETDRLTYFSHLNDAKNAFFSRFKLLRRLFRAEITQLYHFKNDVWMCIAKKAIFKLNSQTGVFEKCRLIEKGSRPLSLCQSNDGVIYYGEYFHNPERKPVNIMQSCDEGRTWSVAYTFDDGEINHIHGIFSDPFTGKIWVATGDSDKGSIIGFSEDGFKTFSKQYCGSQLYRACVLLFAKDSIIYATDSERSQNYIRSIDRRTGKIQNLCSIQGSGINAAQNGQVFLVSTTVEPSKTNLEKNSHLWYSCDGLRWLDLCSFKKDFWKTTYFQFGTIRFPHYEENSKYLVCTGHAVKELDGKSLYFI